MEINQIVVGTQSLNPPEIVKENFLKKQPHIT